MSGQMKTTGILITLTLLLFVGAAHAAELIFEERFETAGWDVRAFRPGYVAGTAALTTNHAHGGTYSMRGNLKHGVSDGIDGSITGHSNSLWEIDFNNLAATSEAGIIYASMYFRFDDANWAGVDEEGDPATVLDGKFHYITEVSDGLGGMYNHVNQYGSPSYHSVSGNDGSKLSQAWALANWGNYGVYGSYAPTVILPDGQWHRAQYVFDYTNDTFSIWFDGVKFTSSQVTDGKIPIPSDWKWRGLQLFYYKSIGLNRWANW